MRRLAITLLGILAVLGFLAPTADAQSSDDSETTTTGGATNEPIDVLQVNGLFDDIVVNEIGNAIERAVDQNSQALVLQVNVRGAVASDDDMATLFEQIADAPLPIGVWVGPSGARLYGVPVQILAVADVTGMAPGARVGHSGDPVSPLIDFGSADADLRSDDFGLSDARALGVFKQRISDEGIATMANMLDALDGFEKNGVAVNATEEEITDDGTVQRTTVAAPRFAKLGLVDQLLHTVASPPVAYLLLLIGLALLIFEFYTAGVGIAGVVGAVCTVLACYGLTALPTRTWAVALLVAAFVAFAIDVQVGLPRVWTGVGLAFTVVGSWFLFVDLPGASMRPPWITLIAGVGGVTLTFVVGMPSMTRTRFATPTIGRDWMIGSTGTALERLNPEGTIEINDAQWRARTNRATPIQRGDEIRVIAIDGVTLEVEPLEGAAKDYREMRGKKSADVAAEPVDFEL